MSPPPAPKSSSMAHLSEAAKLQAEEASAAFNANQYSTAETAYLKALHTANSAADGLYIALLQNLATAHLQLKQPRQALMHAVTAMALFPDAVTPKPCVLAARAAGAIGNEAATAWLVCHTPTTCATDAIRSLSRSVDMRIGSQTNSNRPILGSPALATAIVHAALALPDVAPASEFFSAFEGTSISHVEADDVTAADLTGRMSLAATAKAEGNEHFKAKNVPAAILKWRQALALLPHLDANLICSLALSVLWTSKQKMCMPQGRGHMHAFFITDVNAVARQVVYVSIALLWNKRHQKLHCLRAADVEVLANDPQIVLSGSWTGLLCAEQALRALPDDVELLKLHKVLSTQLQEESRQADAERNHGSSGSRSLDEMWYDTAMDGLSDDNTLSHQESAAFARKMRDTVKIALHHDRTVQLGLKLAGPEPQDFSRTFMRAGLLPEGCDARKCAAYLTRGSNEAIGAWVTYWCAPIDYEGPVPIRSYRHTSIGAVASAFLGESELAKLPNEALDVLDALGGSDNFAATSGAIAIRVREPLQERMFWWEHALVGDVAVFLKHPYHYMRENLQSFCNVQQHALPLQLCKSHDGSGALGLSKKLEQMRLTPGSSTSCMHSEPPYVHIAVGFVDLGELASTLAKLEEQHNVTAGLEGQAGSHVPEAPLHAGRGGDELMSVRWIGYEASAYACARTLVIAQMLADKAPVDSIVQVWYSSTWTSETLQCFRSAIKSILDGDSVLSFCGPGSAEESREVKTWLQRWSSAHVSLKAARNKWLKRQVGSCFDIANAVDMHDCHALCGYKLTGQLLDGSCGSVTMFELVETTGDVLNYSDGESLLTTIPAEELLETYRAVRKREGAAEDQHLLAAAVDGARRRVSTLQSAISQDRLQIEVHHKHVSPIDPKFAAAVCALKPDSMSWSNIVDYMPPQSFHHLALACSTPHTRHFFHTMNWMECVKGTSLVDYMETPRSHRKTVVKRCEILRDALEDVRAYVEELGGQGVLHVPPLDNRLYVAESFLSVRMHGEWVKAFAGMAPGGAVADVKVLHDPRYWYFVRSGSVMHLELSYSYMS